MVARKKATKKTTKEKVLMEKNKKEHTASKPSRSYVNLIYGAVTVVVLFLLVFFAVRTFTGDRNGDITQESAQDTQEQTENLYTVQAGDTLWSIAESELGSGYRWTDIVAVNNIQNPGSLETGTELKLPEVSPTGTETIAQATQSATSAPTTSVEPTQPATPTQRVEPTKVVSPTITAAPQATQQPAQPNRITGSTYTIQPGDTLWDISIRAYGNGYRWVEIARANNLQNPDLIYSGNKLTLPR